MPTYTFTGLTAGRTATVYKQGGGADADSVGSGTVDSDGTLILDLAEVYGDLRAEDGRSISFASSSDHGTTQQADLASGAGGGSSVAPSRMGLVVTFNVTDIATNVNTWVPFPTPNASAGTALTWDEGSPNVVTITEDGYYDISAWVSVHAHANTGTVYGVQASMAFSPALADGQLYAPDLSGPVTEFGFLSGNMWITWYFEAGQTVGLKVYLDGDGDATLDITQGTQLLVVGPRPGD